MKPCYSALCSRVHSNMEKRNFTEDGNHKSIEELFCAAELTGEMQVQLICLSVLNTLLSITAFLGNTLILVALHKESSLHPPSKLLFRNMATTDMCVGIISEPLCVTYLISVIYERWNICRFASAAAHITGYIVGSVSLLTLTAISVDRLLALLSGLRYRQVVTLTRTYLVLAVFWAVAIAGSTMYFWNSNYLVTVLCSCIGISLCLGTSIFCYTKISLTLCHNSNQVQNHVLQGQPSQTLPLNIARYKKTVSSALYVQLALVVCYLPHAVVGFLLTQRGMSSSVFHCWGFAVTLLYLNSSLNPILYCWKIRDLRQAVKDTLRELCTSLS